MEPDVYNPTDLYGFKACLETALRIFEEANRRSGRTTRMLKNATDDTVIVVHSSAYGNLLNRELRDLGKKTKVLVCCHPYDFDRIVGLRGNLVFDHEWVRQYYAEKIRRLWDTPAHFIEEMKTGRETEVSSYAN